MRADVAILAVGTTLGWRQSSRALADSLERAGCTVQFVPVTLGHTTKLRRNMLLTDAVEALGARLAVRELDARALIILSITNALLQRPRVPYAVRFDTLAHGSRPGPLGALQRAREPSVLAGARVLLPFGEPAQRSAESVLRAAGRPVPPIVRLPMAIEEIAPVDAPVVAAAAYVGNPQKRGMELLLEAWRLAAPGGARLLIGGLERERGLRFLARAGIAQPPGVEFAGRLPREQWLPLMAGAGIFINAARYEDWGIAQLEALAAGVPLVTVPTPGPNEALALARRLDGDLVAPERTAAALAEAIRAGLGYDVARRARYRARAGELLTPYREEAVQRTLRQDVLPVLLG